MRRSAQSPRRRYRQALGNLLTVALVSCSATPPPPDTTGGPSSAAPSEQVTSAGTPDPVFPADPGRLAPAHTRIRGTGAQLADVDGCATCHPDVAAQWSSSAHALSSFSNPLYRSAVERFRTARGARASRFCAGCHDLALLADGAVDRDIDPADPRAHAGVSCLVCHAAERASVGGNGALVIDVERVVLPELGDSASVKRHVQSVAPLPAADLCAACHRVFLSDEMGHGVHLSGVNDFGDWQASAFNRSEIARPDRAPVATCRDCHMRPEIATRGDLAADGGRVSSHRVAGGHSLLMAMIGDDRGLAAARSQLRGAAELHLAKAVVGERSSLDVVIRNLRVGHRFPGGVTDVQDTWLEVTVKDSKGRILARSGAEHGRSPEPGVHRLSTVMLGPDARPRLRHEVEEFSAPLVDHTIEPRGYGMARFTFETPETGYPLRVEARLLHRSRNFALIEEACRVSKTPSGRAFTAGARAAGRLTARFDPCVAAPITEIASASAEVDRRGAIAGSGNPFERFYAHGEALLSQVQERVEEARAPLERAMELAANREERARVAVAMVALEGRLGRYSVARKWAERAIDLGAATPARARLADAAARVWRWRDAASLWSQVTSAAPESLAGWRGLAVARGSLGDDAGALRAARAGLELAPRDPDLLRVQSVSSRTLHGEREADGAAAAFERFRRPDDGPELRVRCAAEVSGCADLRLPVPEWRMKTDGRGGL